MADIGASSNYDDVLKVLYPFKKVLLHAYQKCPLLAMMPKRTDFGGKQMDIVQWYGTPQGVSSDFSTAQTRATAGSYEAFNLTRKKRYGVVAFQGEQLDASMTDPHAFIPALQAGTEGIIHSVTDALCADLYGNGGGALGQVGSISTTTLTLKNINDIVNFEKDQEIESSETDGTSGSLQSGTATVTGVDRDLGTLESDSNWTAQIATLDADDYLFRDGDFGAVISGVRAWVPDSAPSATAFFGVDRTADVTRLGGVRYDPSTEGDGTIEEALQGAVSRLEREGAFGRGRIAVFMNTKDKSQLSRSLGSKARYEKVNVAVGGKRSKATIGFKEMVLDDFNEPVSVFADPKCPQNRCFALLLDSWVLASLGPAPKILMKDGNKFLRESDDDAYELRVGYYGNVGCHAPGWNANIDLSGI